jgi:hypothetical protein
VITQELLKQLFDYQNGVLVWKVSTSNSVSVGDLAGYIRPPQNYRYIGIKGKYYLLHRLVYFYHFGTVPKFIDHIDGNKLNNRIENLRACTHKQNHMNRGKSSNNTSGHKGVSWYSSNNSWCAKMSIDGEVKRKFFKVKEDAVQWVTEMRNKFHKEFANND